MALRIRKSITLGTGVASDIQSTGGGARYELRPHGRRGARRTWASAMPAPAWSIPAKPGLRAPRHERDFFMGLEELQGGRPELALQRFEAAARRDTRGRALSDDLLAGLTALELGNPDNAAPHLEVVVASDVALPDGLLSRYAPGLAFELSITPAVGAAANVDDLVRAVRRGRGLGGDRPARGRPSRHSSTWGARTPSSSRTRRPSRSTRGRSPLGGVPRSC
jgi:hypothetical protein